MSVSEAAESQAQTKISEKAQFMGDKCAF